MAEPSASLLQSQLSFPKRESSELLHTDLCALVPVLPCLASQCRYTGPYWVCPGIPSPLSHGMLAVWPSPRAHPGPFSFP